MFKAKASTNITHIETIIITDIMTRKYLPYLRLKRAKHARPTSRQIRYPKFISIAKYTRLTNVNINRAIISAICTMIICRRMFLFSLSNSSWWNLCHTLLSIKQKHTVLSIRYFLSSLRFYSTWSFCCCIGYWFWLRCAYCPCCYTTTWLRIYSYGCISSAAIPIAITSSWSSIPFMILNI